MSDYDSSKTITTPLVDMLECELSSSPCMANEFSGDYFGHCDDEELFGLLLELLGTERAVAKVCAFSLAQAECEPRHNLLLRIQFDEIKNCEGLTQCIDILGRQTQSEYDSYFDKSMAIEDFMARMQFIKRNQELLVCKINEILPRVAKAAIFEQLKITRDRLKSTTEMLDHILQL